MSKDKLYAVKNDEGEYWDFDYAGFWRKVVPGCYTTITKKGAEIIVNNHGGHVVTFIEEPEPEKVVLTKEQAEIVEKAHTISYPAYYISVISGKDEELLMNAYVNGYMVAKEKKYLVYKKLGGKHTADVQYAQAYLTSVHSKILWIITSRILTNEDTDESFFQFTEAEIEHYGLQDCERVEVTDDAEES